MSPRSIRRKFVLGLCCLLLIVPSAFALRVVMANLTPTQKVLKSDVVVTGKVVDIEKATVEVAPVPNAPNKVTYQIGLIRIQDSIHGAKDLTQIRVGWQFGEKPVLPQIEGRIQLSSRGGQPNVTLEQGQEGCFFLKKHPTADFYVVTPYSRPLEKKAEGYDKELASIKAVRKVIDKPIDALKAEKTADRQLAASILIQNHAEYPTVTNAKKQPRQEPIDEEESRLILKALGEMTWENPTDPMVSLSGVMGFLNLTPQDGWKQPAFNGQGDFGKIMKETFEKWHKENGEKFRVKRWVVTEK